MKKKTVLKLGVLLFTVLIASLLMAGCTSNYSLLPQVSLSEAISLSKSGYISDAAIQTDQNLMVMTMKVSGAALQVPTVDNSTASIADGQQITADIDSLNFATLQNLGFVLPAQYATVSGTGSNLGSTLGTVLPILFFVFLLFLLFRSGRRMGTGQADEFGRSKAKLVTPDMPKVTFKDVAGVPEAKQDLQEVVEFLRDRYKFVRVGAHIPRGVLLVGPPGTGKTLLARAVAGEAGVPFFSISGSEFVEMFVGVGASRVRDLFTQAKQRKPSIIFIDEIDAVGRRRGAGPGSGHDEREQTLNQILTEMDGFEHNEGVIVLAATNRPDILDPALLRPGRFDRRAVLDRPDTQGRKAILEVHARNKPLDASVNLDVLAKQTVGFSGADLANLMNEAALLTARQNKTIIGMQEIEESIDRVIAGPERKSRRITPQDKELTAYHEGGHALVAHMLPHASRVHKISIVARGMMGGYTRLLDEDDRYLMRRSQIQDTLATFLGGHTAEEVVYHDPSSGPHNDMKQATELARRMVADYGMSDKLGPRTFSAGDGSGALGYGERDYSEKTAEEIDAEVHRILDEAHEIARRTLTENRARLDYLVQVLMEKEVLEGPDLEAVLSGPLPKQEAGKLGPQPTTHTEEEPDKPKEREKAGKGVPVPERQLAIENEEPK